MQTPSPILKDLVLVGGGHSHVAVLKNLGMNPLAGLRVTVISRDIHTPYSGMLPGLVAGQYGREQAHIDLRPLCRFAGARLYHDAVEGIDLEQRRLRCAGRPPVAFDLVSFDIGSRPRTAGIPGADAHTTPVKPVDAFLQRFDALCERLEQSPDPHLRVAVVGGGAGGVELLLSLEKRLRDLVGAPNGDKRLSFDLFSAGPRLLQTHNERVSRKFERIMAERRIDVHLNCRVARVEKGALVDADGTRHAFDEIIWVTDAAAPEWVGESGLATDDKGFIAVDDHLRSTSHPFVFAAGDIASMTNHDLAKSGVYAVRQGKPLAENLRRAAQGRRLTTYRPQRRFLSLVGTGEEHAVGSRGWLAFEGKWVWKLKDWIDTRWMEQWDELPEMEQPAPQIDVEADTGPEPGLETIATAAMRCGGCGSKLGADVLSRVLARLDVDTSEGVVVGLNAPDDCAVIDVPAGKLQVQSVDFFRTFIDDPYTFGRIAANHALGDIWAMGATAHTALAVAVVPYASEAKVEDDLFQLLAGANAVLRDAGASLVGGHSGEGAEMAFGLQLSGLVAPDAILRKGGMRPGDQLILTKPLGTGTLFAADMRGKAKGRWIDQAIESMVQSNRTAAECLTAHGATACTDVTGFGVLGHLVEMCRASQTGAELDLDALPLLDGAAATVQAGIFSSLQPDNVRLRRAIENVDEAASHPHYPLLFDPQTAGGLLASVPAEQAEACVAAMKEAGYAAATVIGRITPALDTPIRLVMG